MHSNLRNHQFKIIVYVYLMVITNYNSVINTYIKKWRTLNITITDYSQNWLIWKDPDAGNDQSQEEKRTTEDEMVGWHHRLDGHGFEQTLGVGDGQGSLVCCSPWGCKELDTTEQLNWKHGSKNRKSQRKRAKDLHEVQPPKN